MTSSLFLTLFKACWRSPYNNGVFRSDASKEFLGVDRVNFQFLNPLVLVLTGVTKLLPLAIETLETCNRMCSVYSLPQPVLFYLYLGVLNLFVLLGNLSDIKQTKNWHSCRAFKSQVTTDLVENILLSSHVFYHYRNTYEAGSALSKIVNTSTTSVHH
jgi:hypothetical protein